MSLINQILINCLQAALKFWNTI